MNRLRTPSPALVIACLALFVALGGVAYAAATIGSSDIIDGSIRNRDFKDGTLRGNEAKRNGFGGGAIKETTLDASQLGKVANAGVADGLSRHAVVTATGTLSRGRGATSVTRSGEGQYQVVMGADVKACTYFATLGDPADGAPPAGEIAVSSLAGNANGVLVVTRDSAGAATVDRPFHLIVSC
jgi:hypothetical protein